MVAIKKTSRPGKAEGVSPEAFGALLLDLYRFARELTLADFQRRVLERLSEALPFDAAWWGMCGPNRELHSSFLYNLPDWYVEVWCGIREQDLLAGDLQRRPGVTVYYGPREIKKNAAFAKLLRDVGVHQTLGTLLVNPALNLSTFLSLDRMRETPAYSESDMRLKQLVMPHLWAAWTSNWIAQLTAARAHTYSNRVALAVADLTGTLHAAEPRFAELVRTEWPDWQGPLLPGVLRKRLGEPFAGHATITRLLPVSGLYLVEVRTKSPIDRLTGREHSIAERFGNGESYKEIAAALQVSPATVRAHLRTIYTKLSISDKTELANLLSADSDARPPALYI
jgi:DNA-binding CsgD family transcriptional regulator